MTNPTAINIVAIKLKNVFIVPFFVVYSLILTSLYQNVNTKIYLFFFSFFFR